MKLKLIASLIVRDEMGRYLEPCLDHLTEFCDEIRVVDDHSTDGTRQFLIDFATIGNGVRVLGARPRPPMFEHEGRARQELFEWTLQGAPTHILAIDADEFIADGQQLRRRLDSTVDVWTLPMQEVWELDGDCLCIRHDGGWQPHASPVLYRAPTRADDDWKIRPMQLACGREPVAVRRLLRYARPAGTEILHFGWTNEAQRAARHARYVEADGGRFHQRKHLDSILWTDDRVHLAGREWPAGLARYRPEIERRARLL